MIRTIPPQRLWSLLFLLLLFSSSCLSSVSAAVRPNCNQTQYDDGAPNCVLMGSMIILTTAGQPYLPYPSPGTPNQTISDSALTMSPYWPLVRFQLQRLNADPSVLPNTQLASLLYDTQVSPGRSLFGTLELIQQGSQAIIGPLGSFLSTNAALVTAQLQTPQLSFTASAAVLADKTTYPTFFRVCQNDAYQGRALVYMMRQVFGWNSVALISTDEPYGSGVVATFSDWASIMNLTVSASVSFTNGASATDVTPLMKRMRDSGARIFAYLGQPESFPSVMLAADSLGMINNHTVWWTSDAMVYGAYDQNILELARGALSLTPQGGIGPDWDQFTQDFVTWAKQDAPTQPPAERWTGSVADVPPYSAYLVDSLSTMARALHELLEVQHVYRYTNSDLLAQLKLTDFQGYSGRIKFDENLDRTGIEFQLQNLQPGGWKAIGSWNAVNVSNEWNKYPGAGNVIFRDGTTNVPPSEDPPVTPTPDPPNVLSTAAYNALLVVPSILLAALLFSGLIIGLFRTSRVVHSAAPNLLALVVLGGMMILISVMISVFPQSVASCTAQAWLAHLGFILSFGTLILKTYRVHRILANQSLELSTFDDLALLKVVGCFLIFDASLLLARSIAAPYQQNASGDLTCLSPDAESTVATALMSALLLEKALMIVVGSYVCWTARNLPQLFKEQFYTSLLAYNILILAVVWCGVRYGTSRSDIAMVTFQGVVLLIGVALLIFLILIPKGIILVQTEVPRLRLQFLGSAPPRLATAGTSKRKATVAESINASAVGHHHHLEAGTTHNGEHSIPNPLQGGVKSILRLLNNVHVDRVRLLHHHVRELARLQSSVLVKQTEVEEDRDMIYQIRTEADYYKAIGDKARDEHVVQLFLERLNQFVPSIASYMSDDGDNQRVGIAIEGAAVAAAATGGVAAVAVVVGAQEAGPAEVAKSGGAAVGVATGGGGGSGGSADLAAGDQKKTPSGSNGGIDGSKSSNTTPTPNSTSNKAVATKVQVYSAVRGVLRESALKSMQQQQQQQQQQPQPRLTQLSPAPDQPVDEARASENRSSVASGLGDLSDPGALLNPPYNSVVGSQSMMMAPFDTENSLIDTNVRMFVRKERVHDPTITTSSAANAAGPLSPVMEQIEVVTDFAQLQPQASPTITVPTVETNSQVNSSASGSQLSIPASPEPHSSSHDSTSVTKELPAPAGVQAIAFSSDSSTSTTNTTLWSTTTSAASSSSVPSLQSSQQQKQQQQQSHVGSESTATPNVASSPSLAEPIAPIHESSASTTTNAVPSSPPTANVVFHITKGRDLDLF